MTPGYTIILPVRNGGEHLKQCVQSVLAQNYDNFELAILENCSQDGSWEWLTGLCDPRVRLYPAPQPLAMADNWARAVEVPKKEFVTFLGHDDLLDPDYLQTMTALIGHNPEAALYHAHFRFIDEAEHVLRPCRPMAQRETAAEFWQAYLQIQRDANGTGYVLRSHDFDRAGGFPHFHKMLYADHALWLKIVRDSGVATAPEECFSYRLHTASTSASAQWRDHLQAIQQFIAFLKDARSNEPAWNEDVARVFDAYGPAYFFNLCRDWYAVAVVQATKQNRRIEPGVLAEFTTTLKQIAPGEVERFRNLRSLRLRRGINAFWLTRVAYMLYILVRYGKSELPVGA